MGTFHNGIYFKMEVLEYCWEHLVSNKGLTEKDCYINEETRVKILSAETE